MNSLGHGVGTRDREDIDVDICGYHVHILYIIYYIIDHNITLNNVELDIYIYISIL